MKEYILDKSIYFIKKYSSFDEKKLIKIKYGLEGIYLTLSKFIIISFIAIYLGIFKELLIFILFFSIIRTFAFGLHFSSSFTCLIASSFIFLLFSFSANIINIPLFIKTIIGIICFVFIFIYAPADTLKRPLINNNKRTIYKYLASIISFIYVLIIIFINNNFISNILLFSLITEVVMIIPITYQLFKIPYNNYMFIVIDNYKKEV